MKWKYVWRNNNFERRSSEDCKDLGYYLREELFVIIMGEFRTLFVLLTRFASLIRRLKRD